MKVKERWDRVFKNSVIIEKMGQPQYDTPPPQFSCVLQSSGGGRAPGTRSGATQEEVRQTAEGKVFNAVSQKVTGITCGKTSCRRMGAAVSQGKD